VTIDLLTVAAAWKMMVDAASGVANAFSPVGQKTDKWSGPFSVSVDVGELVLEHPAASDEIRVPMPAGTLLGAMDSFAEPGWMRTIATCWSIGDQSPYDELNKAVQGAQNLLAARLEIITACWPTLGIMPAGTIFQVLNIPCENGSITAELYLSGQWLGEDGETEIGERQYGFGPGQLIGSFTGVMTFAGYWLLGGYVEMEWANWLSANPPQPVLLSCLEWPSAVERDLTSENAEAISGLAGAIARSAWTGSIRRQAGAFILSSAREATELEPWDRTVDGAMRRLAKAVRGHWSQAGGELTWKDPASGAILIADAGYVKMPK
jgi:hypothetical protein